MAQKQKLTKVLRAYILGNPTATAEDIVRNTGASRRTIYYVKQTLVKEGLLPPNRRLNESNAGHEGTEQPVTPEVIPEYETLDNETLQEMADDPDFEEEILEADDETKAKILKEAKRIAFDPKIHPDTRMSAMQLWLKIKDVAKSHDLGPGPPRSRDEILERLSRLMRGCGPKISLEAFHTAFQKEKLDEQAPNLKTSASPGAPTTSSSS